MVAPVAFALLHTVFLHVLFVWALRRWPADRRVDVSHLPEDVRRRKAMFTNRLGTALNLLAWPVITVGSFFLFVGYDHLTRPAVPGAAYAFHPNEALYLVPALVIGFLLCGPAGLLLVRVILGSHYHEAMACGDRHFNLDIRRVMYVVLVWLVPFTMDWVVHQADQFAVLAEDRIVLNSFWTFGRTTYGYDRVAGVYEVGDYVPQDPAALFRQPRYVVVMNDGARWTSADYLRPETDADGAIVEFVARRSAKPVRLVATADEIPAP